jgi:enoyl-CoA hydratase
MSVVRFEVRGAVGIITLNRPDKLNTIDAETAKLIEDGIDRIEADDQVRAGILLATMNAGRRPVFCAGHDMTTESNDSVTARGGFAGIAQRQRQKPLIAAVDGLAAGGGAEIALACDIIVATPRSAFALPEAKWNLFAGAGGVFRLTRSVGRYVASDILLTCEEISGRRAYELGLASRLAEPDALEDTAMHVAGMIAANGPQAVMLSRAAVAAAEYQNDEEAWATSDAALAAVLKSEDCKEGQLAFAQRRTPQFKGR